MLRDPECNNGNSWGRSYAPGGGPGARSTRTLRCCNSFDFLTAVDNDCCWVQRATFDAPIDIGNSFVTTCEQVRYQINPIAATARPLRAGVAGNRAVTAARAEDTIIALPGPPGPDNTKVLAPLGSNSMRNGLQTMNTGVPREVHEGRPLQLRPVGGR
jgi:hypothetical protein